MTTKIRLLHDTVGIPTGAVAVTQSASDNTTKVATTAYVTTALANLADSAPSTLNTLNELAAALGDDANFSTTVTNSIALKAPLATPQFTNRVGIGVAAHGTAGLNITSTAQHMRLNNGSELGIIHLLSSGELELWGHGDGESINFRTGSGTGTIAMNVVGDKVGIGETNPDASLHITSNTPIISFDESDASQEFRIGSFGGAFALYDSTDSAYRLVVDGSGNVAIGSTTDALANMSGLFRILDSTGGDRTVAHFGAHNYGDTGKTFINIGSEYGDGTSRIGSFNDTGNSSVLVFDTHSATSGQFTERMRINSSGKVGIATSTNHAGSALGYMLTIDSEGASGSIFEAHRTGNGRLEIYQNSTGGNYIDSLGTTAFTAFATGGTERMRIDASGNVGIGEPSPSTSLHVSKGTNGSGLIDVARFENQGTTVNDGARIQLTAGASTSGAGIGCLGDALNSAHLVFHAGGNTERMRIDSSGHVGFGQSSPNTQIHVGNATETDSRIQIAHENVGGFGALDIDSHGSATLRLLSNFSGSTMNGVATGKFGLMTPHGRDIVFGTNGTERFRISSGKTGIAFNSDTAQANHLDDYEEGTYNATISCASGSITLYTSYTALRYTKIGRQVHIHGKLAVNSVSSPTGATNLNLPFVISNDTNRSGQADNITTGYFNGSAVTNGYYPIYGNMMEATSVCRLFIMTIPGTHNLGDNYTAQGTDYHINFTYTTD